MNPTSLIVATFAALSIVLIALGVALASRGGTSVERLQRYAGGTQAGPTTGRGESITDLLAQSAVLANLNKAVERRDFGANLLRDLGAADLTLKPSEYLAIWAGSTVGLPFIFFLLGALLPSFRSPLVLLVALLLGFMLPRLWLSRRKAGRLSAFNKQLPDTVTLIANALRAGSSFLQAVELVVRESRPPISTEFGRVIREVNLGLTFDVALENMVRRVKSEDFDLLATAVAIQHQVGGNLAEILDSIAFTIRERVRIKGEIRTLTAQQRMSGYVVGGLPVGLALFIYIAAPSFFDPMFAKPPDLAGIPVGVILIVVAVLMMAAGFMAIRKIVDIQV
ncbi:MAG TPA: type II secretion system F family protein [Candidatus Eisenbacteria bacterium]|nr:type II secretion system F family protein [Candidatus Eisenbacteria bacterium]